MRIKALYRSRILPVFFLALCGSVFAQTLSLSVDDAVGLALENNSSVQRERLAESVARARSAASWNAFLPDISLSAALRNVHELAGLDDTVRPDPTGTDLSASAGIRLSLQAGVGETLRQTRAGEEPGGNSPDRRGSLGCAGRENKLLRDRDRTAAAGIVREES
ncbi:MAG TPA: TolC family protein [Treponemataceae bacterium]|nr:TolC family protein [Treponemataceae bacterium]